ncbi:MAG: hypothetical protein FWC70_10495 [Defluviitaleaceae bacterium]|nr:hypothetical protein [Defluviitaleaceae bacterium]
MKKFFRIPNRDRLNANCNSGMQTGMKIRAAQILLFAVGIVLIALGVLRGELSEIFAKGSLVCLECIGLG